MRGDSGLVFGPARSGDQHWYLYVVGGDGDEVQLNIGMWPDYIRVGLGFQIGRTARPKIPAFRLFQTFLGVRPPLPFREAFYRCVEKTSLRSKVFQPRMQTRFFTGLKHLSYPPTVLRSSFSSARFGAFLRPVRRGSTITATSSWSSCHFMRSCCWPEGDTSFILNNQ